MDEKCVYFDGLSAQANPCSLHITDECFYVYLTEQNNNSLIFTRASIVNYHLNEKHLTIKFGEYPHHVVECYGSKALEYHSQLSKGNLVKTTEGYLNKYKLAVVLSLCLAFIAVVVGAYFIVLPWVSEKSASLIPLETEIQLGESIAESVIQSNDVNDSATYYANQFVAKLNTQTSYPIKITVLKSDEINAFAVPGGKLFIYSGILYKMNSYQELSALLGHEISHVTYQHSLKSICRSLSSTLFISALFGDVTGVTTGVLQQANEFKQLNYSRELETQADDKGYEMMVKNHIAPKGMIDLLMMLDKESHDTPSVMTYFSSHPETTERIKNIERKAQAKQVFTENQELKVLFDKLKSKIE